MMDRNREARRAAAMTNGGLPRRRHRTTTASLRDSPEDDGPLDLQETARLRDRPAKKDRDRDRLNRSKRRRGVGDDTSDESVNDEDDDDDGPVGFAPPSNLVPMTSSSTASNLIHRKSFPPPSKVFRSSTPVAPSCKTPEEMITFSVPRKARSVSTKRSHDCWSSGGGGDQIHRQASSSPVRSSMTAAATAPSASPSPSPAPMSPSSSNVSIKKKLKPNGPKQKPPPKSCPKSSPSIQEEIEIEVAEVLYGLMRQSQAPSNDSAKLDRSTVDSKSGVLTTVAPKRKRPRPYPEEIPAARSCPISPVVKVEADQPLRAEVPAPSTEKTMPGSVVENGDLANPHDPMAVQSSEARNPTVVEAANGVVADAKSMVEDSGVGRAKVEEASSSPKMESQDHNRVESTSTSNKANSALAEKNQREEKFEIDLMASPTPSRGSPEREGETEYGGGTKMGDEKFMVTVTHREAEAKAKEEEDEKGAKRSSSRGVELNVKAAEAEAEAEADGKAKPKAVAPEGGPHKQSPLPRQHDHHHHHQLNLNKKERNIDLQLDLEKAEPPTLVNGHKLQPQPPPNATKDEANADNKPGQSSSVPLAMSVAAAGWHGGLGPMGYVAPLQGVVSMDGTPMPPPIQPPLFRFSLPRPKRCATHSYIAKSIAKGIEAHQKMMKSNPFWPAKPYNLNMVPPPSEDKGQPFTFFPGQPASMDKSQQLANAPDSAQKKQFLLPQTLPPGAPTNVLHAPALFFPFGQQQAAAAAAASACPGAAKSPSTAGSAALSSAPMGTSSTATAVSGPAMSFSFPNMGANETQFMAILGNSPYPFPIPAHVGAAATSYRGSHPQAAMSFFNGSFYSPQMLHPSQLQQQQQQPQPAVPSQSYQMQQQNHQNPSSSSQKHVQSNQQQRPPQGNTPSPAPASNSNLQNFQAAKGRHDLGGGEDSPSTADSRAQQRPNLSVYAQNFAMPSFHSPNFGLMTPPSSNGSHGDKKQQQQQQTQQPAFPMSFASISGATTPGIDMSSSMAHNHTILQSLPEAARHNYNQIMAAAAQAAQAAHQKKNNNYQDATKTGAGDPSNAEEERKAMASRAASAAASVGQSIAFSRDLAENSISTMPGNNVVDTSARSLNLLPGSAHPTRSSGPNTMTNSQQQQQQQMLFPKQQQFVAATVAAARSKNPATSNGSMYTDHLTSSSVMAAKFPNALPGFPALVQTSGAPSQSPQWKNSMRPNTSQVSSPPIATTTSTTSTIKNLPQQQGRPQQNHTQISFGAAASNPKQSQGQLTQNSNRAPSPPMRVGSPSTSSISKSAGGSPRTATSTSAGNKAGPQASTLSNQQGKNSPSPSISSQKPSILGSPHMMSTTSSASKSQLQESSHQQQQLPKQSIQQGQLFFNAYTSAGGGGYYLQRHRPENQQQQQQQGSKPQGSAPPTSSSGMFSLCTPVSLANATTTCTLDPAKAVANSMKGGSLPPQGMFHAAQFAAAQSGGGTHQLLPPGFPYVHAVPTVKPADQKQPAGE